MFLCLVYCGKLHYYFSLNFIIKFKFYSYRSMEDFVTWTDTSAIKKHVMEYNEMVGATKTLT